MESAHTRQTGRSLPRGAAGSASVGTSAIAGIGTSSGDDLLHLTSICLTMLQHKCVCFQEFWFATQRMRRQGGSCKHACFGAVSLANLPGLRTMDMPVSSTASKSQRAGRGMVFDSIVDAIGDTPSCACAHCRGSMAPSPRYLSTVLFDGI